MIQSMTGYGKAVAALEGKKVYVEIKSLNSTALDLSTRIAPLYREKEMQIRQTIAKALERGKVDFSLWVEKNAATTVASINQAAVADYYAQVSALSAATGIPVPADILSTLLRMPDALATTEAEELTEAEWDVVSRTIDEAIANLVDFRKQEGAALERKFNEKVDNIEALLHSIEIRQRIADSLQKLGDVTYDAGRLEQEMIYYIEKLDINEEKQRLTNHLNYFRETLRSGQGQGKKLGFIAQEMGREINTTGSKSNQAEMQNIVVKMKDELEQIKEQVLNVM